MAFHNRHCNLLSFRIIMLFCLVDYVNMFDKIESIKFLKFTVPYPIGYKNGTYYNTCMSEKQSEAISFINSDKFGVDTWMTLTYFAQNSHDIMSTIELYGILIERLEKYNLLKSYNARDVIRLKQQIVLDVILKTQILIESTMVLIHSLSVGYHTVAKNMAFYDKNLVTSIISELVYRI